MKIRIFHKFYKMNEFGEVFRFTFRKLKLKEFDIDNIKEYYNIYKYSRKDLSELFNISLCAIDRILKTKKEDYWIKMKPILGSNKRFTLSLFMNDKIHRYDWSRLVCEVFHGPCPDGMECCHNDGNPLNYHPSNVRWDTPKNNQADRVKHKTEVFGSKCYNCKIQDDDIPVIKYLCKFISQQYIAQIYGVQQSTINKKLNSKRWKHITLESIGK